MTVQLALIRHGHTDWNRSGRLQGRTDIALDDNAIEQLEGLELPEPWNDALLVSSPLQRARRTAELIGGRAPQAIPELIEMNWGDWEGQHGKELKSDPKSGFKDIEDWGWSFRPPNGESVQDLYDRVTKWADTVQHDTVAVCHIGVMRALLARASGWSFRGPAPFQIKRNRLFIIEIGETGWKMTAEPVRLKVRTP